MPAQLDFWVRHCYRISSHWIYAAANTCSFNEVYRGVINFDVAPTQLVSVE